MEFVSSLIAVVGLADQVISCCRRYVSGVKDCPSDLRLILVETSCLKSVLENLEFLYENSPDPELRGFYIRLDSPNGLIQACRECLGKLDELLPDDNIQGATGKRKRATVTLQRLAWPLRETRARKLLGELGSLRASISLALATGSACQIQNTNAKVQYLCDQLDKGTRSQILKWLVTTDPSSYHNSTCALRESHTGLWLQKSPEYSDWKEGRTPLIWFYGIPGAGKTVLFSYIVEDIKPLCNLQATGGTAYVYYYCYFGRNQDESVPFMQWTINQLARQAQHVPAGIKEQFDADQQPSLPVLIDALAELAERFDRIYLLVDALDESASRSNLLQVLQSLNTGRFHNIDILAMSREEADIKFALKYAAQAVSVSLSNPYVDEDIATYIRSELAVKPKLRLYPVEVKQEIETALIRGAKGMFRWASCQIEVLGRLNSLSDLRAALSNLPRTLEEIYQRILIDIPKEHWARAKKALLLLSANDLHLWSQFDVPSVLAEAIAVDIDRATFDQNDRVLEPIDFLQEICSCLIRVAKSKSGGARLLLAHYTVKEYLYSDRMGETEAKYFQCSAESAAFLASASSIVYLLNISYTGVPSAGEYLTASQAEQTMSNNFVRSSFPFLHTAIDWVKDWSRGLEKHVQDPTLQTTIDDLLVRLFWPGERHRLRWLEWYSKRKFRTIFPLWRDWNGREASVAFSIASFLGAAGVATKILQAHPLVAEDRSIFSLDQTYARYHRKELVLHHQETGVNYYRSLFRMLSEEGGDAEQLQGRTLLEFMAQSDNPSCLGLVTRVAPSVYRQINSAGLSILSTAIQAASYLIKIDDRADVVHQLIQSGAEVNPAPVSETPLQSAVRRLDTNSCSLLLKEGALVNEIGNDNAIVARIKQEFANEPMELDKSLLQRGYTNYYKSPLRIVLDRMRTIDQLPVLGGEERLRSKAREVARILEDYGGISLCLFPVPNLPGYRAEDWDCLREAHWHGVSEGLRAIGDTQ